MATIAAGPWRVSVITVSYNSGHFLPRLFESLSRQTLPHVELILVDNASTDGSLEYVRQQFPSVTIIESGSNVGFAVGNNIGFAHATADYIALLNSDAWVDEHWLERLVGALIAKPDAAVAVGKIYLDGTDGLIDQAGGCFNNAGNFWGRGHRIRDEGQFDTPGEVAGVTACAMLIRRAAIESEPLFDSDFFMYGEELDLTLRLRGRGWSIAYIPDAITYHKGMGSLTLARRDAALFQQFHANRNRLKVITRRYPARILFGSAIAILLGVSYWNAVFLLRGGPRLFLRSVASQIRYAIRGYRQRSPTLAVEAANWLPWLTRHSVREMLTIRRQMLGRSVESSRDIRSSGDRQ